MVFQLPAEIAKNKRSRVAFCNAVAREVIERRRGSTKVYIFETSAGQHRSERPRDGGWRGGKDRAVVVAKLVTAVRLKRGLSVFVHDMRHTFGERLRAAGVTVDTVGDLLGHREGRECVVLQSPESGAHKMLSA